MLLEENLQARIRGNILMALSNRFRMACTCNRQQSEMATGCTNSLRRYGRSGLAVLGDLYKTQVYMIAERLNELEEKDVIPSNVFLGTVSEGT